MSISDSDHVRVRQLQTGEWVWEYVIDRQVVQQSPPFQDRETCDADAKQQGMRVAGAIKNPRLR